jgi:hypothetical protein
MKKRLLVLGLVVMAGCNQPTNNQAFDNQTPRERCAKAIAKMGKVDYDRECTPLKDDDVHESKILAQKLNPEISRLWIVLDDDDRLIRFDPKGQDNRRRSIVGRFSEVTVLGQSAGTLVSDGNPAVLAKATDASVGSYRPLIMMDSDADTADIAEKKARKLLMDGRLNGIDLQVCVQGHRLSAGGALWQPGMRVHLVSEPHGIDGIFFLMGRSFMRSMSEGTITWLRLKEDGVWTLDALPDRRGKKIKPVGAIVDVSSTGLGSFAG